MRCPPPSARRSPPKSLACFAPDSLQTGDRPAYDLLLERFPASFHEPYYAGYAATDLDALFAKAGLDLTGRTVAFFSKILAYDRSGRP